MVRQRFRIHEQLREDLALYSSCGELIVELSEVSPIVLEPDGVTLAQVRRIHEQGTAGRD